MSIENLHNERELLHRVANGDTSAFQQLLNQYHIRCYRIAIKLIRDQFAAEDIVQEVFLKVWLRRKTLLEIDNFGGWLRTVTVNILYDYIRKTKTEKEQAEKWWYELKISNLAGHDTTEEENYFEELLSKAIDQLPAKQKQTFNLVKKQGYSREEAAKLLGVSIETIKTNLERAMKSIRAYCLGKLPDSSIIAIFSIIFEKYF